MQLARHALDDEPGERRLAVPAEHPGGHVARVRRRRERFGETAALGEAPPKEFTQPVEVDAACCATAVLFDRACCDVRIEQRPTQLAPGREVVEIGVDDVALQVNQPWHRRVRQNLRETGARRHDFRGNATQPDLFAARTVSSRKS